MKTARPDLAQEHERRAAQYVFLIDIAAHLGRTTTAVYTKARRLGISPITLRRESSGKGALAVTKAEAVRVIESDIPTAETIMPADLFKR